MRPFPSAWPHQLPIPRDTNDVNCEIEILSFFDRTFLPFAQKRLNGLLLSTRDMTIPIVEENNQKNNNDDIFKKVPKKRSKKTPFRSLFDPNFRATENVPLEAALAGK